MRGSAKTLVLGFFMIAAPAAAQSPPVHLPITEIQPVRPGGRALAVVVSGDGGWATIDQAIGAALADSAVAVIGLDARRYLSTRRTPEAVAADLTEVIRRYLSAWQLDRVLLVGYSRGAVIAPFIANRLPEDLRQRLDLVAMLGLGFHAGWHVGWTDLLRTTTNPADPAVRPEIEALGRSGVPMMCVFGVDEKESLCRDGADLPMRRIGTAGAHHFDGNYRRLVGEMLASVALANR